MAASPPWTASVKQDTECRSPAATQLGVDPPDVRGPSPRVARGQAVPEDRTDPDWRRRARGLSGRRAAGDRRDHATQVAALRSRSLRYFRGRDQRFGDRGERTRFPARGAPGRGVDQLPCAPCLPGRSVADVLANTARWSSLRWCAGVPRRPVSLLDNSPLAGLLARHFDLLRIQRAIDCGDLMALGITAPAIPRGSRSRSSREARG